MCKEVVINNDQYIAFVIRCILCCTIALKLFMKLISKYINVGHAEEIFHYITIYSQPLASQMHVSQ